MGNYCDTCMGNEEEKKPVKKPTARPPSKTATVEIRKSGEAKAPPTALPRGGGQTISARNPSPHTAAKLEDLFKGETPSLRRAGRSRENRRDRSRRSRLSSRPSRGGRQHVSDDDDNDRQRRRHGSRRSDRGSSRGSRRGATSSAKRSSQRSGNRSESKRSGRQAQPQDAVDMSQDEDRHVSDYVCDVPKPTPSQLEAERKARDECRRFHGLATDDDAPKTVTTEDETESKRRRNEPNDDELSDDTLHPSATDRDPRGFGSREKTEDTTTSDPGPGTGTADPPIRVRKRLLPDGEECPPPSQLDDYLMSRKEKC